MEYQLNQSSWQRAKRDTASAFHSVWFWFYEVCIGAGLTILVLLWAPSFIKEAGGWELTVYQVLAPLVGVFTGLGVLFLIKLKVAPYKQRNEARHALEKLSRTPLVMECYSYEKRLVGETWLKRKQYLWCFNVILTNKSDTQNVGVKAVSLVIRFPAREGKFKSYALSLIPEPDQNKYERSAQANGRPLVENEYLLPNQSTRGFYQFLEEELPWKPTGVETWKTWVTLVVVDSLDAPHRKEFAPPRIATQSKPDKEGSQTE